MGFPGEGEGDSTKCKKKQWRFCIRNRIFLYDDFFFKLFIHRDPDEGPDTGLSQPQAVSEPTQRDTQKTVPLWSLQQHHRVSGR